MSAASELLAQAAAPGADAFIAKLRVLLHEHVQGSPEEQALHVVEAALAVAFYSGFLRTHPDFHDALERMRAAGEALSTK